MVTRLFLYPDISAQLLTVSLYKHAFRIRIHRSTMYLKIMPMTFRKDVSVEDQRIRSNGYVNKSRHAQTKDERHEIYFNNTYGSMFSFIGARTGAAIAEDQDKQRQYDIDRTYIRELYETSPNCAFDGLPLTHNQSLFDLSIDRIDNSKGHTKNNIHLICKGLNLLKNRHTDEDVKDFLNCLRGLNTFMPKKLSRDYISTCVRNNRDHDTKLGRESNIDTNYVIQLLNLNNKCHFTNIPLAGYKHPIFSLSIDRIDNSLGHIKGNVRLVLKGINRAKKNIPDTEFIEWTKALKNGY